MRPNCHRYFILADAATFKARGGEDEMLED